MKKNISIIIPLYNQVEYTKICVDSILKNSTNYSIELILVDNASTDETSHYLSGVSPKTIVIHNTENKGYAGACNQGILRASSPWIIVMNNDVVVANRWIDGLLSAAEQFNLDCVTPGIREGQFLYDFPTYSKEYMATMFHTVRKNVLSGICFAAKKKVFDTVGLFDENFKLGQFEDADLFLRIEKAGFTSGTVGRSFIHHFGSITQKAMKVDNIKSDHIINNRQYFNSKWGFSFLDRLINRNKKKIANNLKGHLEKLLYGHSTLEKQFSSRIKYH